MQELPKLYELIRDDFSVFVEEILGLENEDFHNDIDNIISNEEYKRICIAVARDHGKSTHLSVAYPLWEIAKNHGQRILLVSSTSATSVKFLAQVLNHIEKNEKYKDWAEAIDPTGVGVVPQKRLVGRREEKWTGEAITIKREDLNLKDYTVQSVGLFGSILSGRADIIIVDDLVNQKNSETQDQRDKVKDWVFTTLMPILVPGGRFIYLGNTWHQDDLVADLLKNPQFHYRKKMPAIIQESAHRDLWNTWADIYLREDIEIAEKNKLGTQYYLENKTAMDEGTQVLWEKRHPYSDLYLKRLENSYAFMRMYQCDPSQRPNQKILDVWIQKAIERGKNLILQDEPRAGLIMADTTGGLDLAISMKETADDTAFITLDRVEVGDGEFQSGDYIIRNIDRGKMTPNDVRNMVQSKYYAIGHTGIRVETVAYQESMKRDLADMAIPVKGHQTGGEKNDSDIGINSIAILLELGKLVIPYGRNDARTIDIVSKLLNEMRSWPDGHTGDSLMALWFAYLEMRDHKGRGFVAPKSVYVGVRIDTVGKTQEEIDKQLDLATIRADEDRRAGKTVHHSVLAPTEDTNIVRRFTF